MKRTMESKSFSLLSKFIPLFELKFHNLTKILSMSNEEVMAALRQMATNAMAQAANKAATQEVLGRAVTSNQEQMEEEVVLPIIEVTKPKLSVERQIQVHDDVIVEKEEPEVVEVVISNVQFDEQVLNDETVS